MNENSDLENRLNELEREKLQKRIAELEAELGVKPTVNEEPVVEPGTKPAVNDEPAVESGTKLDKKEKPKITMPMWARLIVALFGLSMIGVIILLRLWVTISIIRINKPNRSSR